MVRGKKNATQVSVCTKYWGMRTRRGDDPFGFYDTQTATNKLIQIHYSTTTTISFYIMLDYVEIDTVLGLAMYNAAVTGCRIAW